MKKGETEKSTEKKVDKQDVKGNGRVDWFKRKNILFAAGILLITLIVAGRYVYTSEPTGVDNGPDLTGIKDIGVVRVSGGGLPGYDLDRDGKADYLSKGFGYYKELYDAGGFEYRSGVVELEEFAVNLTLPELFFVPDDILESGVGSVVSFAAEDQASKISVTIIYKTLGPAMDTYNVIVRYSDGETYRFTDIIPEEGGGTFEEGEVDIAGHAMFRE